MQSVRASLPGAFNAYNLMAAITAVSSVTGLSFEEVAAKTENLKAIKGRMTVISKGQPFEAEIVKGRLESEGIPAMIMNNSMSAIFSTYTVMAGPVSVLVNPQDEERAKQLLQEQ